MLKVDFQCTKKKLVEGSNLLTHKKLTHNLFNKTKYKKFATTEIFSFKFEQKLKNKYLVAIKNRLDQLSLIFLQI